MFELVHRYVPLPPVPVNWNEYATPAAALGSGVTESRFSGDTVIDTGPSAVCPSESVTRIDVL